MHIMTTFTQICCLIPCPIALIVFAIPPMLVAMRRRRAAYDEKQVYQDMPTATVER